jgi:hypothetical protein
MTYRVKIKDYEKAFDNADDYVYELYGEDVDNNEFEVVFRQVETEWKKAFPFINFIVDATCTEYQASAKKYMYDLADIGYAEFETEEDLTLFMLRWS